MQICDEVRTVHSVQGMHKPERAAILSAAMHSRTQILFRCITSQSFWKQLCTCEARQNTVLLPVHAYCSAAQAHSQVEVSKRKSIFMIAMNSSQVILQSQLGVGKGLAETPRAQTNLINKLDGILQQWASLLNG